MVQTVRLEQHGSRSVAPHRACSALVSVQGDDVAPAGGVGLGLACARHGTVHLGAALLHHLLRGCHGGPQPAVQAPPRVAGHAPVVHAAADLEQEEQDQHHRHGHKRDDQRRVVVVGPDQAVQLHHLDEVQVRNTELAHEILHASRPVDVVALTERAEHLEESNQDLPLLGAEPQGALLLAVRQLKVRRCVSRAPLRPAPSLTQEAQTAPRPVVDVSDARPQLVHAVLAQIEGHQQRQQHQGDDERRHVEGTHCALVCAALTLTTRLIRALIVPVGTRAAQQIRVPGLAWLRRVAAACVISERTAVEGQPRQASVDALCGPVQLAARPLLQRRARRAHLIVPLRLDGRVAFAAQLVRLRRITPEAGHQNRLRGAHLEVLAPELHVPRAVGAAVRVRRELEGARQTCAPVQ
mmetsp:Transcript_10307/g.32685  ORF Transcript_10307/g.32685 Transcript_10307/m.32685 type:complete len:410 (-) Transcript_10307:681-1910(-)